MERRSLVPGDFYVLIPPRDDIHRVRTTSPETSVSIHLLTNDTGCVWRHSFDPASGEARPFRSGYVNVIVRTSGDSSPPLTPSAQQTPSRGLAASLAERKTNARWSWTSASARAPASSSDRVARSLDNASWGRDKVA